MISLYHTDCLRNAPLGYFFGAMTRIGATPDYAEQIPPRDRWDIVAYIRALQMSQNATQADVPAGQKVPSPSPEFRGDPGSGATLPMLAPPSPNQTGEDSKLPERFTGSQPDDDPNRESAALDRAHTHGRFQV